MPVSKGRPKMPKPRHPPCRQHHRHTSKRVPVFAPPTTRRCASRQAPSSVLPPTCRRASKRALRPAADSLSRQQALCQHSRGRQQAVLLPLLQTLLIVAPMVARWGCSSSLPPRRRLVVAPASEHRRPPHRRLVSRRAVTHARTDVRARLRQRHRAVTRAIANVRARLRQRCRRRHASK